MITSDVSDSKISEKDPLEKNIKINEELKIF